MSWIKEFSKSLSLANENLHDKSPSLAEGDLGGGLLENDKNSQNPLNSKENSQILENSRIENSNAEFTHPQTPSAREGAYLSDFAQQGALNGANYTLQGKGASRAVPQAREGEILDCSLARNGEFMVSPFAKDISQNFNTKDKKCVI